MSKTLRPELLALALIAILILPVITPLPAMAAEPEEEIEKYTFEYQIEYGDEMIKWHKTIYPLFTVYKPEGRIEGKIKEITREHEYGEFGHGPEMAELFGMPLPWTVTYRLPWEGILAFPSPFVGDAVCGSCHPKEFAAWVKSRHNLVVRFPEEVTEGPLAGDKPWPEGYLPPGFDKDTIYVIIGTPRQKYCFFDNYLQRVTFYIEGGTWKDKTGTVVGGSDVYMRAVWGKTEGYFNEEAGPALLRKIAEWVPEEATPGGLGWGIIEKWEAPGPLLAFMGVDWGWQSYGGRLRTVVQYNPYWVYCEICKPVAFDFASEEEFKEVVAAGDVEELKEHTLITGVGCEICHGPGGHLPAVNVELWKWKTGLVYSDCSRCHQRFWFWYYEETGTWELNAYHKTRGTSCGTEMARYYYSKHWMKARLKCVDCHDPHDVTTNAFTDPYTVPKIITPCERCHEAQAKVFAKRTEHLGLRCAACHMPMAGSCTNFVPSQVPDYALIEERTRAHAMKIVVDPEWKMIAPPPGKDSTYIGKWRLNKWKDGYYGVDLMHACARTSPNDKYVLDWGCHGPIMTKFPAGSPLIFESQEDAYETVIARQKPVKDAIARAKELIGEIRALLAAPAVPKWQVASALANVKAAEDIIALIEEDGSYGIHAMEWTVEQARRAVTLLEGAKDLLTAPIAVAPPPAIAPPPAPAVTVTIEPGAVSVTTPPVEVTTPPVTVEAPVTIEEGAVPVSVTTPPVEAPVTVNIAVPEAPLWGIVAVLAAALVLAAVTVVKRSKA